MDQGLERPRGALGHLAWHLLRESGFLNRTRGVKKRSRTGSSLAAQTRRESSCRYLGSCHEAEQWTKAHERERTCEMETGNGRFEIDIESGRPLYAMDAIRDLRIEKLEARYVDVVARASDNKIDLHVPQATFPISHLELHALVRVADLDHLLAHMDRHLPQYTILDPPR
jgi:hypothetical protein